MLHRLVIGLGMRKKTQEVLICGICGSPSRRIAEEAEEAGYMNTLTGVCRVSHSSCGHELSEGVIAVSARSSRGPRLVGVP